ncbi:hypothetical protein PVV11_24640, partial [Salmonella enterica subsp. enterica serovar Give]|uniref:TniQ family protein n=1 Tax=Salmonella enterica TaxID=28901 RepID=UPI002FF4D19E
ISMTKADLRLAVQRLISSSIVMLMSVISTHYDLSRISVGHYSLSNFSLGQRTLLKFCPVCAREDTFHYGVTYWHLAHQLHGVTT